MISARLLTHEMEGRIKRSAGLWQKFESEAVISNMGTMGCPKRAGRISGLVVPGDALSAARPGSGGKASSCHSRGWKKLESMAIHCQR